MTAPSFNSAELLKLGMSRATVEMLRILYERTGGSSSVVGSIEEQPGVIKMYGGSTPPSGYLLCDGAAISRTTYAPLFSAIGITWGPGDGTTTFNLPDLRNRFLFGAGGSYSLGDTGGAAAKTLGIGEIPAHNHGVNDSGHSHGVTDGGHSHTFSGAPHGHTVTDTGHTHNVTDPGHTHTQDVSGTVGTGSAINTGATGTTSTGSATTGVTVDNGVTGVSVDNATAGGTNSSNTTGVSVNSATTGITTQNTGSGVAFSIMPPYAVINWIIKT